MVTRTNVRPYDWRNEPTEAVTFACRCGEDGTVVVDTAGGPSWSCPTCADDISLVLAPAVLHPIPPDGNGVALGLLSVIGAWLLLTLLYLAGHIFMAVVT